MKESWRKQERQSYKEWQTTNFSFPVRTRSVWILGWRYWVPATAGSTRRKWQSDAGASLSGELSILSSSRTAKTYGIATVPDVKRLCGSGVMGQSELPRGEVGKGGRPAGRGLGCLKLLLSEKSDWDSAAAPSKGERAVRSDTLMGTTRLGLVKPGGGEGESLVGIWGGGVEQC